MAILYAEDGTPYEIPDEMFEDEDDLDWDEDEIEYEDYPAAQGGGQMVAPEELDGFEEAMARDLTLVQSQLGRQLTNREIDQLVSHAIETAEAPSDAYVDVLPNQDMNNATQRVAHAAEIIEDESAARRGGGGRRRGRPGGGPMGDE